MPRTEARIFASIWGDGQFLALPATAQRLYMFLLSQPDLTYCGVMPLRPGRWARKASGLTLADVERDLKELEAAERRFVVIDAESGELMVRSLLRRDGIWRQPNLLKQARESADQVESLSIRAMLARELQRLPLAETSSEQVRTLVADFIGDLVQGTGNPSAYPPGNPGNDPSGNPGADPADDPSGKDYARAQGLGAYVDSGGDSPVPLFPEAPIPRAAPTRDRKTGTRLPDDFRPDAEMVAWARQNAPHVDGKRETERFCDYWRGKSGKDACKRDWIATWRNWMRTAEDRQGPRDRPGRQQQTDDQFDRAMQRAQQREGSL